MPIAYISDASKYRELEDPQANYGLNKIVYVRGTKEGYQKIKPIISTALQSKEKSITRMGKNILNRYMEKRTLALDSKLKDVLTYDYLEKMQDDWAKFLSENLTIPSGDSGGSLTASVIKTLQGLCWALQNSDRTKVIQQMYDRVEELENYYNGMSAEAQASFMALEDPTRVEGFKVNMQRAQKEFDEIKRRIDRIANDVNMTSYQAMTLINTQVGNIGEALDIFMTNRAFSLIDSEFAKDKNVTIIDTGAMRPEQIKGQTISTTAKPDEVLQYSIKVDENEFTIQAGISLKTTGTVVDKNGKWVLKTDKSGKEGFSEIQIFSTQNAWQLIQSVFNKPRNLMDNATLNTLVWGSSTNDYKLIQRGVVAKFFEQFLAGGGTKLAGSSAIDIADCIVVNGTAVPVMSILGEIVNVFETDPSKLNRYVQTNFVFANDWVNAEGGRGTTTLRSKKSLTAAIARSEEAKKQAFNRLNLLVRLNGNVLYNIAKSKGIIS